MTLSDSLRSMAKVLKLSRKPDMEEFRLSLRICFLGMIGVGVFGFIIQLISTLIMGSRG